MIHAAPHSLRMCPFTVLVDHREQSAWSFTDLPPKKGWKGRLFVPVSRAHMVTGDYTIAGLEDRFALERKSLEDLYGTLGQNRERFEAELQRLQKMDFAAVVIEATLREVWCPQSFRTDWRSKMDPRAVESTMVAWAIRYPRVHWWTVGGHREGEVRAFEVMEQFWRASQHEETKAQA